MGNFQRIAWWNLLFLILFGIAFGFVESAVVYYLRHLINFKQGYNITDYKTLLNLGFISFIKPLHPVLLNNAITSVELVRESATIIMLIAVAFIAGRNLRQRMVAFLVASACWDVFYYVFLKVMTNWPASLNTKDIYFLIPIVWVGPVITPLLISVCLFVIGTYLYIREPSH